MLFADKKIESRKQWYNLLGAPSIKDFKAIITINAIMNLLVIIDVINLAEN
jgi:hypothetical protein